MEYIDEQPVLDFDDCIKFIVETTEYDAEIVEAILDAETEYMCKVGIIHISEYNESSLEGLSAIKK